MESKYDELDKKIEKMQAIVFEKHKEYNDLVEQLEVLLDERYPERKTDRIKDALYDAYIQSDRSLDEILDLIQDVNSYI